MPFGIFAICSHAVHSVPFSESSLSLSCSQSTRPFRPLYHPGQSLLTVPSVKSVEEKLSKSELQKTRHKSSCFHDRDANRLNPCGIIQRDGQGN